MRDKYQEEIESRTNSFRGGYSFTAKDFLEIAEIDPSNKVL